VAPDLVSAVLRERLRLLAKQNPMVYLTDYESAPLRPLPSRRAEQSIPQGLPGWVDHQSSRIQNQLFNAPGGCRFCHLAKRESHHGFALAEYEPTNVPSSWFPYAKFSHVKHGLMACGECHDAARTSTQTADVLMPSKQTCVACHSTQENPPGRARADCLECHPYHRRDREEPALLSARRRGSSVFQDFPFLLDFGRGRDHTACLVPLVLGNSCGGNESSAFVLNTTGGLQ
jgi:predicted CXXCH cytochrome family protein